MENPANLLSYQAINPFLFEQTKDGIRRLPARAYPTLEIHFKDKTFPILSYTYEPLKIYYGSFALNLVNDMADCGDEQVEINPYDNFDFPYNFLVEMLDAYHNARDFLQLNEDLEFFDEFEIAYQIEKFLKEYPLEDTYDYETKELLKSQLEEEDIIDALSLRLKKLFEYFVEIYYGDELQDTGYGFTLISKKGHTNEPSN